MRDTELKCDTGEHRGDQDSGCAGQGLSESCWLQMQCLAENSLWKNSKENTFGSRGK